MIYDRYSGNRTAVLDRDGRSCLKCGMTEEQHKEKFDRGLTVDHKDGLGRGLNKPERNDSMENLQTLCLPCHGKKDRKRRGDGPGAVGTKVWCAKLNEEKVIQIRELRKSGLSYRVLGQMFGVSPITAYDAVNKTWRNIPCH
jgi:hypothetical protein